MDPTLWSTWDLIQKLAPKRALEIGCGNKPRISVENGTFLDINSQAVERLKKAGASARVFDLTKKFPFADGEFDLVCSFETLEHLTNDKKILGELSRVLAKKGRAIISFPLNMSYWTGYDAKVGHVRRYEPIELTTFFGETGLVIESYSAIAVAWPNWWQAPLLSLVVDKLPRVAASVQNHLELLPSSPWRGELKLRPWTKNGPKELAKETTAIFVLTKK